MKILRRARQQSRMRFMTLDERMARIFRGFGLLRLPASTPQYGRIEIPSLRSVADLPDGTREVRLAVNGTEFTVTIEQLAPTD